jgi:hypothetical protein
MNAGQLSQQGYSAMSNSIQAPDRRRLFCVMSAQALPYAEKGIQSLFAHALEPVSLTIITDGEGDKKAITESVAAVPASSNNEWAVFSEGEADERAADLFRRHPNIGQFRKGHPCWRKLTDPILFSSEDAEMIILDPDLYFPNRFRFEPTPATGLQLMWQPPSCLLPDSVVMQAYSIGVRLAHHVDIGVAQLRNKLDLEWLDWFIGALGGASIPRAMHVEAIVWSALAMRMGGGYFDPRTWYCWQYRQWKRVALKLGVSGVTLLKGEKLSQVKCYHASGVAKWFVKDAVERNLFAAPRTISDRSHASSYVELTMRDYLADQRMKRFARKLGYYKLLSASN